MAPIVPGTGGHKSTVQFVVTQDSQRTGQTQREQQNEQTSSILGKDSFLQLLVAQLANQDPTNPMEDREFIAQMAQFSSLEQMNNVASELRGLRLMFGMSSDLIGKSIEWIDPNIEGTIRSGVVDSIVMRNGEPVIVVGNEEISYADVTRVSVGTPSEEAPPSEQPDQDDGPSDGSDGQDGGDTDE